MSSVDNLVTVVVAAVSGGGVWTFLQFVIGRRSEAARQQAEKEERAARLAAESEDRKDARTKVLAEAQELAQQTALDSAATAYQSVRAQCDECRAELVATRKATEKLVDAVEALIEKNGVVERQNARLAIREYRAL